MNENYNAHAKLMAGDVFLCQKKTIGRLTMKLKKARENLSNQFILCTSFLPAELVRPSAPVVSAQSVWLSFLQTAPSFHSPPFSSPFQPEPRASARSLCASFAADKREIN